MELLEDLKPDIKELENIRNEDDSEKLKPCFFETEECALKNNPDYQSLLSCLALLHSQRSQAHKDLNKIISEKNKALSDPIGFVAKLQKKDEVLFDIPKKISVAEIPEVNWDKYIDVVNKAMQNYQVSTSSSSEPLQQSSIPPDGTYNLVQYYN